MNLKLKQCFPHKFEELNTSENLIEKLNTSVNLSSWCSMTVQGGIFANLFLYKNFLIIKCFGKAQKFEYCNEKMKLENIIFTKSKNLVIETENEKIYIHIDKKYVELLQNLIDKNLK